MMAFDQFELNSGSRLEKLHVVAVEINLALLNNNSVQLSNNSGRRSRGANTVSLTQLIEKNSCSSLSYYASVMELLV